MDATTGSQDIVIGIIDGPVEASHPDFTNSTLESIQNTKGAVCRVTTSSACNHGTFIAGMLCAGRSSRAPAMCPHCRILVRPIFCEATSTSPKCPEVTPDELASAIIETVKAGAKVINLSIGLSTTPLMEHRKLEESFEYAFKNDVLLVAASGNHGRVGHIPLFNHDWVIPVAACDTLGNLLRDSNIGPSVGKRGLMALGLDVSSTSATGGYTKMSGTSVAAPFVTGTIALLWSLFPDAAGSEIRRAVLLPGIKRKSIIPPLLNDEESWRILKSNN